MKYVPFLLIATTFFGQDVKAADLGAIVEPSAKSVIVIDPKARSADFAQVFDALRKDKPSQRIMIRTTSTTFNNVTDVIPSTGGTLVQIKVISNQGARIHILPIEQLMEIGYSP